MRKYVSEEMIEDTLSATQKPFDNRLQVVCYLWLADRMSQEMAQKNAIELAAFLGEWMFMDVDRGAA